MRDLMPQLIGEKLTKILTKKEERKEKMIY
jgi:hypothetical protein